MRSPSMLFMIGCVSAAIGVAAGAFGAHGLRQTVSPEMLQIYEIAVRYQLYHSFGILVSAFAVRVFERPRASVSAWLFVAGTVLFSGSLYVLTLTGIRWLGAITPLGGVAFILGWVTLGMAILKNPHSSTSPDSANNART